MKIVHIINSIADSNENFFANHQIGTIRVLNPMFGTNTDEETSI